MNEVINRYKEAESKKVRRMILGKVLHTREVVQAGLDIMTRTGEVNWDQYKVCTVCLLHDIGRFSQALLGSYSDSETGFDHAEEGAKIAENAELSEMEGIGIDKKSVMEAIQTHSGIAYEGENDYAKLVRDADKLALLRYMPYLFKTYKISHNKVNPVVMNAYKNKEMVKHADVHVYADRLLSWLCWESDFNFKATDLAFVEEGPREWLVEELKKEGVEV
jgi:HD superfamily phosphohydrolase YqeK